MRKLLIPLFILALAPACMADVPGSWTAVPKDDGRLHVSLAYETSHNGTTFALSDFTGLTDAQVHAAAQTPVQFELRREAGTVTFEGTFKNNFGAGQFTFKPSRGYYAAVRALGIDTRKLERDEDEQEETLFALALHDVSTAYIKSMIAEGYRVDLDEYLAFRIFRVTPQLVADFRALGYRDISADDLVATQVHKVTPAYIREMRAAGFTDLTLDELVASRIHKVTPEFVEKMRALGFKSADFDDLVAFRIHKVTPEFIDEVHALGYPNVTGDQLVAMRIHKVTPEFIKEMESAGYSHVPIDKLVAMRIHGIDASYVKKMNGLK